MWYDSRFFNKMRLFCDFFLRVFILYKLKNKAHFLFFINEKIKASSVLKLCNFWESSMRLKWKQLHPHPSPCFCLVAPPHSCFNMMATTSWYYRQGWRCFPVKITKSKVTEYTISAICCLKCKLPRFNPLERSCTFLDIRRLTVHRSIRSLECSQAASGCHVANSVITFGNRRWRNIFQFHIKGKFQYFSKSAMLN